MSAPALNELVRVRGWPAQPEHDRISAIYDFVQNEIVFGYNDSDDLPASRVFEDGYGQCNTKSTLFMALLRLCKIPCRFHGFTVDKRLQKGLIPPLVYALAPGLIIHSWVEVQNGKRWIALEGLILNRPFLVSVRKREVRGPFWGYAVATDSLENPPVFWNGSDTYIQHKAIVGDFGVFDLPDDFYSRHGENLSGVKKFLYRHIVRKRMNYCVARIREGRW